MKIFDFGNIPTNVSFLLVGAVGPPTGTKILQLRGKATGVPTAIANCSFRVTSTGPGS